MLYSTRNRGKNAVYLAESLEPRRLLTSFLVSNVNDSGAGSFREALINATAVGTADTISFDTAGVFAAPQTITLLSALPQLTAAGGELTITGPGAANLTVRRDSSATAFRILNSAAPSLTLSGLTLSGGNDLTDGGGAIAVNGTDSTLSLDGVSLIGNSTSSSGGAIRFSSAGSLSLRNSNVTGNSAADSGGAIYFFAGGSFFVETCTMASNASYGTATGAGGGAIYFFGVADNDAPLPVDPNTVVVRSSTLNNNTAAGSGGAIAMRFFTGVLKVQNSTVVQNTAAGSGGAVVLNAGGGSMDVQNSTVFGNTASSTAAGTGGGGLARISSATGASITVSNSVVSGNTNANGPDIFRASAATTCNVNYSAVGSGTGFVLTGSNNVPFGSNLHLNALANNGGATQTMLPVFLSPLIEGGSKDLMEISFPNDQRGPGFQRVTDKEVDIGAVEQQSQSFVVTNNNDSGAGSLRDVMQKSQTNPASDTITFDPTFFNVSRTISLLSSPTPITSNSGGVTIIGPGKSSTGAYLLSVQCDASASPFNIFNFSGPSFLSGFIVSRSNNAVNIASTNVVSLDNMLLIGNTGSTESHGVVGGGFLRMTNSKITNMNGSAILFGGGGGLLIDNCTISQNAGGASTGGSGGALSFGSAVDGNPPAGFGFSTDSLIIRNSTISDNSATGNGGGFNMVSFTGTLLIQNSTIMFNSASGSGGGVYIASGSGSVTLQSCTVIGNTALANTSTTGGGGIARISTTGGTITIANSVVSGNHNTPAVDIRASSVTTTVVNFSAVGSNPGFTVGAGSGNNLAFGTNLQFTVDHATLGGSTTVATYAPTSPLVNAGSNALASAFSNDQRGPGFARISDGIVDIGSLERQPYVITTTNDRGTGSISEALVFVDADPSADEITFDTAGVFSTPQVINVTQEMENPSSLFGALTITGPGSSRLTLRRAPGAATNFRPLTSSTNLTLTGITISGGNPTGAGGGLLINGSAGSSPLVTLDDVVITGNSSGANGGGIGLTVPGSLSIRNSRISGNTATGAGGGISFGAAGIFVIDNTTVSGNTSNGVSGGGGLFYTGTASISVPAGFTAGTLVVRNSTFSGNGAVAGAGGGIALASVLGGLQTVNCTFNANTAATTGGAISLDGSNLTASVQTSTISGNTANGVAVGTGGGGIGRTTPATITVANSIVSGNTNANAPDLLAAGSPATNVNFSAIGSATGFTLSGTSGSNLPIGANLMLGALANNGGSTQTMLPAAGSPLINAGSNLLIGGALFTDQRGGGFPRIQNTIIDIGAVEREPAPPAVALSEFKFDAAPIALQFTFTADVSASLSASDLEVQMLNDGLVSSIAYGGYGAGNVATFTLPLINDGNYRARFLPGTVANSSNQALDSAFAFDFFVLTGDTNHDRKVNALDFNTLATNFGAPAPRTYAQGDFNYDQIVNSADFAALAMKFGSVLPAPALSQAALGAPLNPAGSLFGDSPIQGNDEEQQVLL